MADDPGKTHVTVNAALMFVMAFLHLGGIGSAALNAVGALTGLPWSPRTSDSAELAGEMTAYAVIGVACLVGLVWAPCNAYGLFKKKPWARSSTRLYWAFVGVFCCCLPGAGYGLWSLARDDTRAALEP